MYCQEHFQEDRPEMHIGLIRQYPLATIVRNTANGLEAEHIPLMYEAVPGEHGKLIGHVARNNNLWQLEQPQELLVIFEGPSSYISPGWYASKKVDGKVVPTWNYVTVHAHCTLTAIHDRQRIVKIISDLTDQQESAQEHPWLVTDAPEDFTARLVGNIVGIELAIRRIQGKWRVSQNHRAENRTSVVQALLAEGSDAAVQVARLVESASRAREC